MIFPSRLLHFKQMTQKTYSSFHPALMSIKTPCWLHDFFIFHKCSAVATRTVRMNTWPNLQHTGWKKTVRLVRAIKGHCATSFRFFRERAIRWVGFTHRSSQVHSSCRTPPPLAWTTGWSPCWRSPQSRCHGKCSCREHARSVHLTMRSMQQVLLYTAPGLKGIWDIMALNTSYLDTLFN